MSFEAFEGRARVSSLIKDRLTSPFGISPLVIAEALPAQEAS